MSSPSPSAAGPAPGRLQHVLQSSIGAKYVMALTGLGLVGFVIVHMLGNLLVFAGPEALNAYAAKLESLGVGLWVLRGGLLTMFVLHVWAALKVSSANRGARDEPYAHALRPRRTGYAARTMLMSGLIVLAFLVYHLLHFTFGVVQADAIGVFKERHDIYGMVTTGFSSLPVVVSYVVAQLLLCLHISHGASSALHTLGLTHPSLQCLKDWLGRALAALIFVGNLAIPLAVHFGMTS